jgi:hypothetical protein
MGMLRVYRDVRSIDTYASGLEHRPGEATKRLHGALGRFFDGVETRGGVVIVPKTEGGLADVWAMTDGAESFLYVLTHDGVSTPGEAAARAKIQCERAFAAGANVVRFPDVSNRPWPLGTIVSAVREAMAAEGPECTFVEIGHRPGLYRSHANALGEGRSRFA